MESNKGLGFYREKDALLHEACAYTLLAIGRASREQGVAMVMPAWGCEGYFEYPNGLRVALLNRSVLVVRPIGYKASPAKALSATAANGLGVPSTGLYFFYLCSNTPRPGGLIDQLEAALECKVVAVDTKIGGAKHDLSSSSLLQTIL